MELTINQIVGYLPFKLIYQFCEGGKKPKYDTLVGLFAEENNLFKLIHGLNSHKNILQIKPVLFPLSDLIKEIEINGEKFVPIEVLLDVHSGHNWSASDYLKTESGKDEWWTSIENNNNFGYNKENGFYEINRGGDFQKLFNQLQLFQKLYEWHFDIHNLIDNGLAIDVNILKTNPYK